MENDWRLTNQDLFLTKVKLKKQKYRQPSKEWDHDHCCFCWEKFSEDGTVGMTYGYSTLDEKHWICESCYSDFKDKFEWEIAD